MRFGIRNSLVLVLLLSVLWEATVMATTGDTSESALIPKTKVEIFNIMLTGSSLTIHCKSKDDDLGTHVVPANQSYGFEFEVDSSGTTLFFCKASWEHGHAEFDIYKASRDGSRCSDYCKWEAAEDAIVGFKSGEERPDIFILWKP
ncbi:hypothetical protein CDL15_Pgr005310 [Punica granatum]|uniref:S-protein homolog n=1 Tax=Punica granatum TaxID=22663 RepID=A0A218XDU6_PUNGR|nr:hypothetical protein CDL15_Pgr005310 [Punica granatum]